MGRRQRGWLAVKGNQVLACMSLSLGGLMTDHLYIEAAQERKMVNRAAKEGLDSRISRKDRSP